MNKIDMLKKIESLIEDDKFNEANNLVYILKELESIDAFNTVKEEEEGTILYFARKEIQYLNDVNVDLLNQDYRSNLEIEKLKEKNQDLINVNATLIQENGSLKLLKNK